MYIDTNRPLSWFFDYVSLSQLCVELHASFEYTHKILAKEDAPVYRLPYGSRYRYRIEPESAKRLVRMYGSEAARKRRLAASAAKPKGTPLWMACPHCGKKGKQWRISLNTAGNREAKCGHCRRYYTIGKRRPLQSTCPHCAATTRQYRHERTRAGNLNVRCAHCKKHYTIKGNPDAAVEEAGTLWWRDPGWSG